MLNEVTSVDKPIEIALHGSYYSHNFGDVFLMALYTEWIRQANPRARVKLPHAPADIQKAVGTSHSSLKSLFRFHGLVYGGGGYFGEPQQNVRKWRRRNFLRHIPIGTIALM